MARDDRRRRGSEPPRRRPPPTPSDRRVGLLVVGVSLLFSIGVFAVASSARTPAPGPVIIAFLVALVGSALGGWVFFRGSR